MAHDARHGFVTPSVRSGAAILRGLALGGKLRHDGSRWRFLDRTRPSGWNVVEIGAWWPVGPLRDASVEWVLEGGFARREHRGAAVVILDHGRRFLRAVDDAVFRAFAMVKTLPIRELRAFVAELRCEYPDDDDFGLAQWTAAHILASIFGGDWMMTHVPDGEGAPSEFFRNASTEDHARTVGRLRLIQLAEMVFNLQWVPGLAKSLEMIRSGDLEPGFAELEVGRMLHINGKSFKFITPKGVKGDDYDLELSFGDVVTCCETKCKLESTAQSESSLIDTLDHARSQLPADRPGIIFAKTPQTWYTSDDEYTKFLSETANKFLRNTKRIVSVKFHSSLVIQTEAAYAPTMLQFEVNNPRNRFYPGRDWRVFYVEGRPPDSWVTLMDECARGGDSNEP